MSDKIHFDRLALVITRPVFWDIEPESHARGLGTFLRLLLTAGGLCVLGQVAGEQRRTDWLTTDAALDWVNTTEDYYVELAPLLRQLGGSATFRLFIQRRCWLFFDHECLLAALNHALDKDKWQGEPIAPDVEYLSRVLEINQVSLPELQATMQQYLEKGSPLYLSFSVDFSSTRGDLIFSPQLVIWNYWPEERRYAPPSTGGLPASPLLEPEQAATILEKFLWKKVETAFAVLRQEFRLGYTEPEMAQLQAQPPVFYFASPVAEDIPSTPDEYFQEKWLLSLQHLVKTSLGTDDPFSLDIAGALLEGELLTFRRELIAQERETSVRYYLILPCNAQPYEGWSEIERDLVFVADKLAFLEFSIAHEARDLITDLLPWGKKLALWGGSIDDVAEVVTDWLQEVAMGPASRRKRAYQQIGLLQQRLLYMGSELMRQTANVLALPTRLSGYMDGTADYVRRAFTTRILHHICPLTDALADAYPYAYLHVPIDNAEKQASRLRETFERVVESIQGILEQEKREVAERQAALTFWLTIAVTALTVATILPSLVDVSLPDTTPFKVQLVVMFRWFIVAAAVVTGAVVFLPLTRQGFDRAWEKIRPPTIRRLGEQVAYLWRVVEVAHPQVSLLAKVIREGGSASEDVLVLRTQVEALDAEACRQLLALWAELQEGREAGIVQLRRTWIDRLRSGILGRIIGWRREDLTHPSPSQRMRELERRTERFILLSMLLDDRPYPTMLPRTLTVFRYKSTDFVASPIVDDYELELVFRAVGYDSEGIRSIKRWCEQHAHELSAEEFVTKLQEIGVGAGRLGLPQEED